MIINFYNYIITDMKRILLFMATFALLAIPKVNFGQAPTLGTTSGFAIFTGAGAITNDGATVITGDLGSFNSTPTGFPIPGTVVGTIYNVGAPVLTSAFADAGTAFGNYSATGSVLGSPLETFNTTGYIYAGTYHTIGAAVLNGDFTLDGQGDPNALFVININGALTVGAGFNILLINSASACNVYWQINGDFTLGAGSVFRGTIVSDGSITLLAGSSLLGRGITTAGAIALHNNVVTLNSLPAAAGIISGTASVCKGQNGVVYSVPAISNAASYNWTLPAGASIASGANTRSITVNYSNTAANGNITVQGVNACANGIVSANFAVTVNPLPIAFAGADRSICLNSGSTTIGAASVPGSTYSWSSVPAGFTSTVSNPTVTPMVTTTYTVVETNPAMNCTNSNSVVVTVIPLPAAIAGANRAICLNSVTQIGAPAITGNTYSWTSVPAGFTSTVANPTVSPLVTTTYTLIETNTAGGCTNTNSVVVTLSPSPAAIAGADRTICANTTTTLGAAAVVGSTYSWSSSPAGFSSTTANPTVTPLVTTTYTVVETTTATGCTNTHSVVVTVNPLPAAMAGANRAICLNSGTQIGAPAVSGSTYSWTSVPAGFTSTVANPTVSPLTTTTYIVVETITATGCSNTNNVVVTLNPFPAAIAGVTRAVCPKESTTLGTTAVTGNTYSWTSLPAGFTSTLANPTINPLTTATYTVIETTTATGCTNTNNVVVTVNSVPAAVAGADRSICFNSSSTILGAKAIPGSTYSWSSVPAGFNSTVSNPTVTPLLTTTYTVVETNPAMGCSSSNSVIVTVYPVPGATAGANRAICLNSSTQIGGPAVAGNTYNWTSVPAGFTSTEASPTVSPLVTTTYNLVETVTALGCINSNSVTVTLSPFPSANAGDARTVCSGEGTLLGSTAVTGNTYSWTSIPAGFTSTLSNPTVNPLISTTYTIIETTTATGCTNANKVVVSVNPLPAALAGAARSICLNSSTQIGGADVKESTYSWSSSPAGFTSSVSNPTVSPNITTTYTVVETNKAKGCTNSNSVVVSVNPSSTAVAGVDRVICQNSSTQIGGTAVEGSTYSWSSIPAGFTSTLANPIVTPLVTTTYTIVETNPAMTCASNNSVVVTVNPLPVAIAGDARAICLNSGTTLGAAAVTGSTYSWSSIPAGFTSSLANPTVAPLASTTYTVEETVTATGCTNKHSVVVALYPAPAAIAGANRDICLKESTRIGAEAVIGSTYSWSSVPAGFTSTEANPNVSPKVTTIYTVVETNAAEGCQNTNSVTVALNAAPIIVTEPTDQTTCVGNPVSFSITVSGTGLTYQWRKGTVALINGGNISGATSSTLMISPVNTSDVASNYNVVITGACAISETSNNVSLAANAAPSISTAVCEGSQVSFSASAIGAGLTYQWRKGDVNLNNGGNITGATSSTLTINPVTAADASTDYNVVIAGTCSPNANSLHIALVVNSATSILAEPLNQTACAGTAAIFTVGATGSSLSYQWRKGTVNLVNGGNISGATSAVLTIDPVSASDVASNYNVVVTGTSCSPVSTSKDAALALCIPTGMASLAAGTMVTAVTIYPNPFKSSIDIKINDATQVNNIELKIYNILGEEVIDKNLTKQITTLATGDLASGIYLYKVNSNNKTIQSGKLVSRK